VASLPGATTQGNDKDRVVKADWRQSDRCNPGRNTRQSAGWSRAMPPKWARKGPDVRSRRRPARQRATKIFDFAVVEPFGQVARDIALVAASGGAGRSVYY